MKTIRERATEYAESEDLVQGTDGFEYCLRDYIKGAIDQKAIDIEKACQWITEHIDIPYEVEHIDGEPVASDYIEWCKKRLEAAKEITDEFRKAMEE